LRNKARYQFIFLAAAFLLIILLFPFASSVADGTQKWAFETNGAVSSSPVIASDGTIYVGSDDGSLYAVNPDGTRKWAFETGKPVETPPAVGADGTIYLGSFDRLYAINPDGTLQWTYEAGGPGSVNGAPAIGPDGTIYVGSWGRVYAINPDGTEKWVCDTGHLVNSSPAIGSDGTVYVGSDDGNLYAIASGSVRAERQTDSPWVETRPAEVAVSGESATLKGTVNPNGEETTFFFEWGYSTSYGFTTAQTSIGSGTLFHEVTAFIDEDGAGLDFTKVYHYRLVATNTNGTSYGENGTFVASKGSLFGANCFVTTAAGVPHTVPLAVLALLSAIILLTLWQRKKRAH